MWRPFFMALGIFSILLGLQSLVIDQFLITTSRRIPQVVNNVNSQFRGANGLTGLSNRSTYQTAVPGVGQSAYGPSRYNQVRTPILANRPAVSNSPQYQLAGYGRSNGQPIQVTPSSPVPFRVIQTRDWMPWCFLAAGTVIVLYSRPRGGGGEE